MSFGPANLDPLNLEKPPAGSLESAPRSLSGWTAASKRIDPTPRNEPRVSAEFEDSEISDLEIPLATSPLKNDGDENDDVKTAKGEEAESTALAPPERPAAWSSAASARAFLEQLASAQQPGALARLWNTHRGDIYLAIAVILVIAVVRWGIWSNHSVSATGHSTPAAAAAHRSRTLRLISQCSTAC